MAASYSPEILVDGNSYFPPPYSAPHLPDSLRRGLIPVGLFAVLSVASTLALILFICTRLVTWRMHYRTFLGYNQYVVLVLNLLLADMQQSSAFLISFHWVKMDYILAPHPACFAQGWLLHSGDVASGFFVLAIAIHTFYTAVYGQRVGNRTFAVVITCIWIFAYLLTGIGAAMYGERYFVRAGAWCWVSAAYETERLALHYIWIFIIEFGTVLIYVATFYQLRKKTSKLFIGQQVRAHTPNANTVAAVNRITMMMTLYPCVYVVLTLPLSAGRMWSMAHHGESVSDAFACTAGALITSCGWVDSLLYTLTRKRLLQDTMPGHTSSSRRTDDNKWEADELGSKGITHTRTVTVEGGHVMDTFGPETLAQRAVRKETSFDERSPSPSGSIDPILSGKGRGRTKTEISVGMQEISEDSEIEGASALPPYQRRQPPEL